MASTTENPDTLIYLYGIVAADAADPPEALRGIEGGAVWLLRLGGVAAVVGDVPAESYSDEAINSRLDDLAWVGERGLAHERVLDWFAERGPVIPLSLFSLHRGVERVEARIRDEESAFVRVLERLRGRREWGVKLWRREAEARAGIDRLSVSLQRLGEEIEAAPPGRAFLLERKRESLRAEEVRILSKRVAHEVFSALGARAVDGAAVPLPGGVVAVERTLLLHAAFLVADLEFEAFRVAVDEHARRLAGTGFEIEFTGPWPPYHFSETDDE